MKFDDIFKRIMESDENVNPPVPTPDPNIIAKTTHEEPEAPVKTDAQHLIDQLKQFLSKGATFASFLYTAKGSGESALFNVNMNIDYQRAKEDDRKKLEEYQPKDELETQAKEALLAPSKPYTNKDTYTSVGKGIRINNNNGYIHIFGYVQNKEVVNPGVHKSVKSSPLTITKNKLKKDLNFQTNKIRDFILDPAHIAGLKLKGNMIEFQSDESTQQPNA